MRNTAILVLGCFSLSFTATAWADIHIANRDVGASIKNNEASPQPITGMTAEAPVNMGPVSGEFVNGTRWRIEIFVSAVAQTLKSTPDIVLNPQETRQYSLNLVPHRLVARAYVDTQFGTRLVGVYDRTILVDPGGDGWALRLLESDFHSAGSFKETPAEKSTQKLERGAIPWRREDYQFGLQELKSAAKEGNIVAQFNLGWMYAKGQGGVPRDYAEAAKWYRRAAEQGDTWAQNNLGEMYARGEGAPRSYVQAYMWLSLAISGGYKPAAGYRDRLAKRMTDAEIAEAGRLATQYQQREGTVAGSTPSSPSSKPAGTGRN